MKTKYFYIGGLNSSKNSSKFLELKQQFSNIEYLEWNENDNIDWKVSEWNLLLMNGYKNYSHFCIIANSTGANFATKLTAYNNVDLILINPLLDIGFMFNPTIIPNSLKRYISRINNLYHALIFIGARDSVIDNVYYLKQVEGYFINNNNQIIIDPNSGHEFENLSDYFDVMKKFTQK